MAASLIDEFSDDELKNNQLEQEQAEETSRQETLSNLEEPASLEPTDSVVTDELPDKYRDKSLQDLVQMHQEAEKAIGRQGSEVGELRKVVDNYIQGQLAQQAPTQVTQQQSAPQVTQDEDTDDDLDWFTDPQAAVKRALDNDPRIQGFEKSSQQARQQEAKSKLDQLHPEAERNAVLKDPAFADWIGKSNVRTKLLVQADQEFDVEAAHELFSLWGERKQSVDSTLKVEELARKQAVRTASTGSSNTSNSSAPNRKVYRTADIIRLMNTDPDRYTALQDEIYQAYEEGRVK